MQFEIDNQTLNDLNIFPKRKNEASVFDFFKQTDTAGGQSELIKMMKEPTGNVSQLNERIEALKFIQHNNISFVFKEKVLDFIEHYINQNVSPLQKGWFYALSDGITNIFQQTNEYYVITKGIDYLKETIIQIKPFFDLLLQLEAPIYFQRIINEINIDLKDDFFNLLISSSKSGNRFKRKLKNVYYLNYFDNTLRTKYIEFIPLLIKYIYQFDALITVSRSAQINNFCLPQYNQNNGTLVNIDDVFHPFIKQPVTNSISMDFDNNMCFLTGANMAGKSTFLKSIGICCYLAHIGFPVPAGKMQTAVFNGLISTINLADDVVNGYSHFYNEVKRVRNTAISIREKQKILIIFDELFRGTNVKDAFDSSLMIISAFAKINQCAFFISTHIVEIAEELKTRDNIVFKYFDSRVEAETPIFSYKLMDGISDERHGLRIVLNEKIVEILQEIVLENESNDKLKIFTNS